MSRAVCPTSLLTSIDRDSDKEGVPLSLVSTTVSIARAPDPVVRMGAAHASARATAESNGMRMRIRRRKDCCSTCSDKEMIAALIR